MKKHLISFIHKPILVTTASLIIALGTGIYAYNKINIEPTHEFTTAVAGSITSNVTTNGDTQHVSLGFLMGGRVKTLSVKVGSTVTKGQVLATLDAEGSAGAITQAQAAYAAAEANYQKVVNGATNSTVNVANTSIATAERNLTNLIQNAYTQVDGIVRNDVDNLYSYPNSDNPEFGISIFDQNTGTTAVIRSNNSATTLDLRFQRVAIGKLLNQWRDASLADTNSAAQMTLQNLRTTQTFLSTLSTQLNTLTYDTKYQSTIDKAKTNISSARIAVDGMITNIQNAELAIQNAQTSVTAVTTSARPEDVQAAQAQITNALGALQVAQSMYNNRKIMSPGNGTVTAVRLSVGEIASANATVIELTGKNFSKEVSVMIPLSALVEKNGKSYALVKQASSTAVVEKEVVTGVRDSQNVEIISGLSVGEQIALQ